jgi:hypothetical protein
MPGLFFKTFLNFKRFKEGHETRRYDNNEDLVFATTSAKRAFSIVLKAWLDGYSDAHDLC